MLIHEACLEHSRGEISVCQSSLVVIVGIVGCFIPDLFFSRHTSNHFKYGHKFSGIMVFESCKGSELSNLVSLQGMQEISWGFF